MDQIRKGWMSELQLQEFLAKEKAIEYWALWAVMADCGLRISEALGLRVGDLIDGDEIGKVVKITGKRAKVRNVGMTARVRQAFMRIGTLERIHHERIFKKAARTVQIRMKKTLQEANLKSYWSPHTRRHTFATRLISGGTPLHEVKEIMGHQSIKTTEKYLHVAGGSLERARGTLERAAAQVKALDSQAALLLE